MKKYTAVLVVLIAILIVTAITYAVMRDNADRKGETVSDVTRKTAGIILLSGGTVSSVLLIIGKKKKLLCKWVYKGMSEVGLLFFASIAFGIILLVI